MTPDQIATWAAAGESETQEFKRSTGQRREAARTLCAMLNHHRDYATGGSSIGVAMYDDRLEVSSSGTLHFGFTPQALFEPHESRPWNPLIASVFYRRGIIETWGQGTLRMAAWAAEAGLPKPEIVEVPGAVVVRFRAKAPGKAPGERQGNAREALGKTPLEVLRTLKDRPDLSVPAVAASLGKSESAIHRAIWSLREAGLLVRMGPDKGGRWKVIA
jgi:ATP-dependent DNA helicase RecG